MVELHLENAGFISTSKTMIRMPHAVDNKIALEAANTISNHKAICSTIIKI
jgi:hypothetical protein